MPLDLIDTPSANFSDRRDGKKPYILLLHYTDTPTTNDALNILRDHASHVSSHYVIGDEGNIYHLVDENMRAWHAGKSYWAGEDDINSCSIGIEIQNTGHSHGYRQFPSGQMRAVRDLCLDIIKRHDIKPHHVLAHSDVAPGRKQDPGHFFPWIWMASEGVGLWPKENVPLPPVDRKTKILPLLIEYGYDPKAPLEVLIAEFQRHFEPEVFKRRSRIGTATDHTIKILQNLLLQKALYTEKSEVTS